MPEKNIPIDTNWILYHEKFEHLIIYHTNCYLDLRHNYSCLQKYCIKAPIDRVVHLLD